MYSTMAISLETSSKSGFLDAKNVGKMRVFVIFMASRASEMAFSLETSSKNGILASSWGLLGHLGATWAHLGAILGDLKAILAVLGAILASLGVILGHLDAILGSTMGSWGAKNIDFHLVFESFCIVTPFA